MLDISKRELLCEVTVGDVIKVLSELPEDAYFSCCGSDTFYLHMEKDGSAVSVDWSNLDEQYEEW